MIAFAAAPGALEIQLSREAMVDLHAVQREIALVGVRLGEAGRQSTEVGRGSWC